MAGAAGVNAEGKVDVEGKGCGLIILTEAGITVVVTTFG